MIPQIPEVDPLLFARCTDAISHVHERDPHGFDADFINIMSSTVMFEVGGDRELALAILCRIAKLIGCIGDEPKIVELFGEKNPAAIPHALAHSAAVAPLEANGRFDPCVIKRTALRFVEARGHA